MKKPNRSRIEIAYKILTMLSRRPRKQTHIMYGANTSWFPMKKIMTALMDQGFVEVIDQGLTDRMKLQKTEIVYRLTEKGSQLQKEMAEIRKKLNSSSLF